MYVRADNVYRMIPSGGVSWDNAKCSAETRSARGRAAAAKCCTVR